LDDKGVINDKNKILSEKDIKIELEIIRRFIAEINPNLSMNMLKNEILKAYRLSKSILEFISEQKQQKKKPNLLEISVSLEHEYSVKISQTYLNFLLDIIKNYFGKRVPTISQSFLSAL
jgi:hypothetical protein